MDAGFLQRMFGGGKVEQMIKSFVQAGLNDPGKAEQVAADLCKLVSDAFPEGHPARSILATASADLSAAAATAKGA